MMVSLFGLCGQSFYNAIDSSRMETDDDTMKEKQSFMKRVAEARWSPMQNLSDKQYESMLKEKLLRIDVEISIIDEKIEELRKQALIRENGRPSDEQ
jgi:signal recognition particle GTPase